MATRALGRQFHGAREQINDTHVRPPSVTGVSAVSSYNFAGGGGRHNATPHTDLAFSTANEDSAYGYARHHGSTLGHPVNHDPDPRHRGRVYEVAPAYDQDSDNGGSEIASPTGFRIIGEHHSAPGVTSTFHEINWNAYKGKPRSGSSFAHSSDANHAYMDVHAPTHYLASGATPPRTTPYVTPQIQEGADEYSNRNRVDDRHPGQLNIMTGKTVSEHKGFNATPGVIMHLHPGQFPDADVYHHDPTTRTIRAGQSYAAVDKQFNTER